MSRGDSLLRSGDFGGHPLRCLTWPRGEQDPFAKKVEACAAEHLALEDLDPIDVAFDDFGVPGQCQAGGDGVAVSVDAGRESVKAGQVVLADGVEPLRESFALAFGEHVGEGPDVTGQGIEFGAVGKDGLEPELFDLGQRLGVG